MSECKWYIVHTASGCEKKVRDAIMERADKQGMSGVFEEILIPSVESSEVRRGKKVLTEKKIMPGYIIVKMKMTSEAWHLVRSIPKVGAFLGSGSEPTPVSDAEVQRIVSHISSGAVSLSGTSYEVGKVVRVIDGPFESFSGVVEEVDLVKSRLRVSVSIFGRETPLDLGFDQVESM